METYGSSISSTIYNQLLVRSKFLKSTNKTDKELIFANANTAWVRLRSSVDTVDKQNWDSYTLSPYSNFGKRITGDSTLSKSYILEGGTRTAQSKAKSGISYEKGRSDSKAYSNLNFGFRPMPGIKGFSVKSLSYLGAILEATINFKVWSLEELEDIEKLYFRPGYTALLEWGHSVYIDNSGNLNKFPYSTSETVLSEQGFFSSSDSEKIEEALLKEQENSNGNYKGMLGYIINFSWSFTKDGGYDCTLKLVSKGSMLDGIKLTGVSETDNITQGLLPSSAGTVDKELMFKGENSTEYVRSKFHEILVSLENKKEKGYGTIKSTVGPKPYTFFPYSFLKPGDVDSPALGTGLKLSPKKSVTYSFPFWNLVKDVEDKMLGVLKRSKTERVAYVTLGYLLHLYNEYLLLKSKNTLEKIVEFNLEEKHKFRTFPEHFTVDPFSAVVPARPTGVTEDFQFKAGKEEGLKIHKEFEEKVGTVDDIVNILISSDLIISEIDKGMSADRIDMFQVLNSILRRIEKAFGGINKFELFYDSSERKYYVIDLNNVNLEEIKKSPYLDIAGLGSMLTGLDVSSTISNEMASQIAISATANSNYYDINNPLLEWNKYSVDRHSGGVRSVPFKTNEGFIDKDSKEQGSKSPMELLKEAWSDFNKVRVEGSIGFNGTAEKDFNNLQFEASKLIKGLSNKYSNDTSKPSSSSVPVELSFTLLGISGLKIGQSFKIKPGLLPSEYDSFGYIITGLEQALENGRWITSVSTLFYYLGDRETKPINKRRIKVEPNTNVPSPAVPPVEDTSKITVEDNAEFLEAIGKSESGGNYKAVNSLGYMGKYQFGRSTLDSIGYNSVSNQEFLNSPEIQDEAMLELMRRNKKTLKPYLERYVGTVHNGVYVTESGVLAGAHLGGAGGVIKFFKNGYNPSDAYGTSIVDYMKKFANINVNV